MSVGKTLTQSQSLINRDKKIPEKKRRESVEKDIRELHEDQRIVSCSLFSPFFVFRLIFVFLIEFRPYTVNTQDLSGESKVYIQPLETRRK